MTSKILRLKPHEFVHILDSNTNTVQLSEGPIVYTLKQHESIVRGPEPMILIPPLYYATIINPVMRDSNGDLVKDAYGQAKIKHGKEEIRFHKPLPFPLYPGEEIDGVPEPLKLLKKGQIFRLEAISDFEEIKEEKKGKKTRRKVGDQWYFEGPGFYYPRTEVSIKEMIHPQIIKQDNALQLRARGECIDCYGRKHKTGEEWLVREAGEYIPGVDEEVVKMVEAIVLTRTTAVHLRAKKTFEDAYKVIRRAGDEWLVDSTISPTHLPDVDEDVVGQVALNELTSLQYCIVLDPVDEHGKPQLGKSQLRSGPVEFFLNPGERLDGGIRDVYILNDDQALLLRCKEYFEEMVAEKNKKIKKTHDPGTRWMIYGPGKYIPPIQAEVIEMRSRIPLHINEGIYVRDLFTGRVSAIVGETYMLKPNEELWEKKIPEIVEKLINKDPVSTRGNKENQAMLSQQDAFVRDPTRVLTYRIPDNAVVQIYDYKKKKNRIQFGPDLAMLGPDEEFTLMSLSGGLPKKPRVITSISLLLGPDFMTDKFIVETSDHARLSLQLAYNWYFDIDKRNPKDSNRIFQIPDFVGDACKTMASKIRAIVAGMSFDNFHKECARAIRIAVFGLDKDNHVNDYFRFPSNNLIITNIDVQSVEPVDQDTLRLLQKSVQLAIKITTESQEAEAKQDAKRREAEANGKINQLMIQNDVMSEEKRKQLLELKSLSAAISKTGIAKAVALANAETTNINGKIQVQQSQSNADAFSIIETSKRKRQEAFYNLDYEHNKKMDDLMLEKSVELSKIDSDKISVMVDAIGIKTLQRIATSVPKLKSRILNSLGLKGFIISDGKSQMNLFSSKVPIQNRILYQKKD